MFQNNYTENSFLFKGLILKNLKIDEITETVIAQVEMPVKEHHCPHYGNVTTYIKDYRIQKNRDLPIIDKPLIVFFRKRRYLCKICNATFTENNNYIKRYSHFPCRFYMTAIKEISMLKNCTSIAKRIHISINSIIRWSTITTKSFLKSYKNIEGKNFYGLTLDNLWLRSFIPGFKSR